MSEEYQWVQVSRDIKTPRVPHAIVVLQKSTQDEFAELTAGSGGHLAAHFKDCETCQHEESKRLWKAHIEKVLMRVIDR